MEVTKAELRIRTAWRPFRPQKNLGFVQVVGKAASRTLHGNAIGFFGRTQFECRCSTLVRIVRASNPGQQFRTASEFLRVDIELCQQGHVQATEFC